MLVTARLRLRTFSESDATKLFIMSQEAGLRRWLPDQVYRDPQHAAEIARALTSEPHEPPEPRVRPYVLGIEHAHALVGHVGLSPARASVEIGYAVEQRLHGQGIATEAVTAMSRWALAELSLPEVLGIVDADNAASCRVLEKAGFLRVGEELREKATRFVYRCV